MKIDPIQDCFDRMSIENERGSSQIDPKEASVILYKASMEKIFTF